ncbi:MAG: nitrilase-related carbon-nitrogen hydrolase, partial [Acidimicrobiales bacterium]
MRVFTAAAVQIRPAHEPLTAETVKANVDHAVDYVERCVDATGASLVVLPETVTTGFTPGCTAEELWNLLGEPDGPTVAPLAEVAGRLGIHLIWGTYSRGEAPGI